jgi:hypothetical protein
LKKEIEEDTGRWKDFTCSWLGRINILIMAILLKAYTDSTQSPAKSQGHSSQKKKIHPQIYMEVLKTLNS